MEKRNLKLVLLAVLAAAVMILAVLFLIAYRNINYLPKDALDHLCAVLASDNILIDRSEVSLKKARGTVYVCSSDQYSENVARQLGKSDIKYRFATPDGELMLLYNGAVIEFQSDFFFHYCAEENVFYDAPGRGLTVDEREEKALSAAAAAFLDGGSRSIDDRDKLNLVTRIQKVYRDMRDGSDDVYYVECTRTIDGLEITGNRVVLALRNGVVVEAEGKWCFLTLGQSYSAQLTDVFNILFNVKKELDAIRGDSAQRVVVSGIDRCYTLYYAEGNAGFCFIPCWQIVTDAYGDFIYNALDGSLYTKKTE